MQVAFFEVFATFVFLIVWRLESLGVLASLGSLFFLVSCFFLNLPSIGLSKISHVLIYNNPYSTIDNIPKTDTTSKNNRIETNAFFLLSEPNIFIFWILHFFKRCKFSGTLK